MSDALNHFALHPYHSLSVYCNEKLLVRVFRVILIIDGI